MEVKTQTNKSTQYKDKIKNFNCFVNKNFEIGIISSKYWGDFENRKIPLIDLKIDGINFSIPLDEFVKILKQKLKGKHFKS